ncbi:Golgi-associated plant pathogenesis-related protein 1-like [Planococcus citri]|uniref:Golgi-associated plant pathogenesis-related protein 1-like n=1 Tax=Planococcus citri TaxID=170843 RepID=UPI0031F7EF5D
MNLFTLTFTFRIVFLNFITRAELKESYFNESTFRYKKLSQLFMEEEFLPSFKQRKIELILKEHNEYRDLHSVPRLELDRNITYEAETWAELLTSLQSDAVDNHLGYGENIWIKETEDIELFMKAEHLNPVRIWYSRIVNYSGPFDAPKNTRSFTQLVWKSSKKLGVGFTYSALVLYVVCFYDPPGNLIDKNKYITAAWFHGNVSPPKNSTIQWSHVPRGETSWVPVVIILIVLISMFVTE